MDEVLGLSGIFLKYTVSEVDGSEHKTSLTMTDGYMGFSVLVPALAHIILNFPQ